MLKWIVLCCGFAALAHERLLAHEITVECTSAGEAIRIAARIEGHPTADAELAIRSATGELRLHDRLDEAGEFRWKPTVIEEVTITVDAGLGHRETVRLSAAAIERLKLGEAASIASNPVHEHADDPVRAPPRATDLRPESRRLVRGLLGIALLLGAGSLWLSARNSRRLGRIEERMRAR